MRNTRNDLSKLGDRMQREKIKQLISISKKAGAVVIGGDNLLKQKIRISLLLIDKTASKSSLKILEKIICENKISVDDLQDLTNINNCKLIGITDKGLSEQILKKINEE